MNAVEYDRAAGAVLASAAADALGAPHEFGPPLPADQPLRMTGGGSLGWAPGEWTDDTQQATLVLHPLSQGIIQPTSLLDAIAAGFGRWLAAGPRDVGIHTRAVLSLAAREGLALADASAAVQAQRPDSAGNGSLMRTGPLGLVPGPDVTSVNGATGLDDAELAALAADVSALTHAHPDCVDACVLWTLAIRHAITRPPTDGAPDWLALVAAGLDHLPEARRDRWAALIDDCRDREPESFTNTGWVVTAFQAALAAIVHTPVPTDGPACGHLRLAIERTVRLGDDTDTVAAIAGALLGATWGATAVPAEWRRVLHGQRVKGDPELRAADLDARARLAVAGGRADNVGWPGVASLLPYYRERFGRPALSFDVLDGIVAGNVFALPDLVAGAPGADPGGRAVDAVVSLCRMGTTDVPEGIEHHVIGLIDTTSADNPNLGFVLDDTCELIGSLVDEGRRVFVHCVAAENRTPAIVAALLVRRGGLDPDTALDRAGEWCGGGPRQSFLRDAVRALTGSSRARRR